MSDHTPRVELVEVAARDGLQNVQILVSTADKVELIRRAADAGIRRIEATSFVHPARVPQMADAEAVMAALQPLAGVTLSALVLNARGAERALAAGVNELTFVVLASESFNQRNQGSSIAASIDQWRAVASLAEAARVPTTFMIGAAFGCPFEGEVPLEQVLAVTESGLVDSPHEVALADTIGCATPAQIRTRVAALVDLCQLPLRVHLHNTRNTGYANAYAAIAAGATALDASIGGLGGCPFAPAATGNIATEDLAWMLERDGYLGSGVSVAELVETARWLPTIGLETDSLLPRAGTFPQQ